jgi:hypothetical protein
VSQVDIAFAGPLGIHNGTHAAMRAAGIACSVEYPEQLLPLVPAPILGVIKDNVSVVPGNPMKDMFLADLARKTFDLPDKTNVTVRVSSDNLDEAVEIIQRCAGQA